MAQEKIGTAGDSVVVGIAELPSQVLAGLNVDSYARTGVILCNERVKTYVMVDGKPVQYTISLYVQREAISDEETAKVHATATERDAKKQARDKTAQEERERAVKAAFEMGQSATVNALRNIDSLVQGAAVLNRVK